MKDPFADLKLIWDGAANFDVYSSPVPQFSPRDSVSMITENTGATNGLVYGTLTQSYYFEVVSRGDGEVPLVVQRTGGVPVNPPGIGSLQNVGNCTPSLSTGPCAYVKDTVQITGQNYDLLSVNNQIFVNQLPGDVVEDATNDAAHLKIRIPEGATNSGTSICSNGVCTSAGTHNFDIALVAPDKGSFNFTGVAFDHARDGGGTRRIYAADWTGGKLFSFPVENGTAVTLGQRASLAKPVIPTMTWRDGALPYISQDAAGSMQFVRRDNSTALFGSTYNATTTGLGNCQSFSPIYLPVPHGMSLNPAANSTDTDKRVWLCDNAFGLGAIRAVTEGETSGATNSNKIDPLFAGYQNNQSFNDICPLQAFPNDTLLYVKRSAQTLFSLSGFSTLCTGSASNNGFSGPNVGTMTLNERQSQAWWTGTPYQSFTFTQDSATHYGYIAGATGNSILRDKDPEVEVYPKDPGARVLISKYGSEPYFNPCPASFPAGAIRQCQPGPDTGEPASAGAKFLFTVKSPKQSFINVWMRVIDPRDLSGYNQRRGDGTYPIGQCSPFAAGKTCDASLAGQKCDNRAWCDPSDDFGFDAAYSQASLCGGFTPSGTFPKLLCVQTDASGTAYLKLKTTKRYAGDNYQVQAMLEDPATNPEAPIKASSAIVTAWKREYYEYDRMFKKGTFLAQDFNPLTCGTGGEPACNQLVVISGQAFLGDEQAVLIQSEDGVNHYFRLGAITGGPDPGPTTNSEIWTFQNSITDPALWEASAEPAGDGTTALNFDIGKSAAVGFISKCSVYNSAAGVYSDDLQDCLYGLDTSLLSSRMPDAYIEPVLYAENDLLMSAVPNLKGSLVASYTDANISQLFTPFSALWFRHAQRSGGALTYNASNTFHMLALGQRTATPSPASATLGITLDDRDWCVSFTGEQEKIVNLPLFGVPTGQRRTKLSAMSKETTLHECGGHSNRVNRCFAQNDSGHPVPPDIVAWCDGNSHCADTAVNYQLESPMYDNPDALTYFKQRTDSDAFFTIKELLTYPACANPDPGYQYRTLRANSDPE